MQLFSFQVTFYILYKFQVCVYVWKTPLFLFASYFRYSKWILSFVSWTLAASYILLYQSDSILAHYSKWCVEQYFQNLRFFGDFFYFWVHRKTEINGLNNNFVQYIWFWFIQNVLIFVDNLCFHLMMKENEKKSIERM